MLCILLRSDETPEMHNPVGGNKMAFIVIRPFLLARLGEQLTAARAVPLVIGRLGSAAG
jgi:hypothetical protein